LIDLAGPSFNELKTTLPKHYFVIPDHQSGGSSDNDMDLLRLLSSATASGASYLFNWSVNVVAFSVNSLMNAFDLVFKATLFFAALYTFLVDEKGIKHN
jgi:hypothetical protein